MFEAVTRHVGEIESARERMAATENPYERVPLEAYAWIPDFERAGLADPRCFSTLESFGVDVGSGWASLDARAMDYRLVLALLTFIWRADRMNETVVVDAVRTGLLEGLLENLAELDEGVWAAGRVA